MFGIRDDYLKELIEAYKYLNREIQKDINKGVL